MRTLIEEITFKTYHNTFTAEVEMTDEDFEIISLKATGDILHMIHDKEYLFLKKELELHVQERWTDYRKGAA